MGCTIGQYLAKRLQDIGIEEYFAIPGDYNLTLLDQILSNENLKMINCCNELNAGYAADGYARKKGASALFVTYSVGGLSAINAVAGAYAENLPLIIVSGCPNTNSRQDNEKLHHTLGVVDYNYVKEMFCRVTAHSVTIHDSGSTAYQIDEAIHIALTKKKPVYIEIPCNIADLQISEPTKQEFYLEKQSDDKSLQEAIESITEVINSAQKPVLVAGSLVRPSNSGHLIEELSKKKKLSIANMPDAKGFISEESPYYIGTYWGPVSSPGCSEVVESSDCYIFFGPQFTDYTTTGHNAHLNPGKLIQIMPDYVNVCGKVYTNVMMRDIVSGLLKTLKINDASNKIDQRIKGEAPQLANKVKSSDPLTTRFLFHEIQKLLTKDYAVIAETGDSWFNGIRLKLPTGAGFEIQMQYGSIGWSVGAVLGYQLAAKDKRVIGLIGDGSFQMTAQELSIHI